MRPPRPAMSNAVPPPVLKEESPPPSVRRSGGLWLLAVGVGVVALVLAFLDREALLDTLAETAATIDSGADAARLDQVALIALWGTTGVFALVLLIEALLVRPLLRGRGWARWALLAMVVADAGAVLLVLAFLGDGSAGFQPAPHLAVVHLVLAVVALVLSLFPSASRWFKEHGRQARAVTK
ncbi:uncharacterized membrane protein YhaH (DUF805 family) [Arthrobacter sp. PL16]|nr:MULTISPECIES: hypothetical protein [Arthrobacter]MEC5200155.1 uncharacterized membrane protein YhaH (DUF805 family) [Arthrobacter sp. PL16]